MADVQIGQKVNRHGVPDRALVRETSGDRCYIVRLGDKGLYVGGEASWCGLADEPGGWWAWGLGWDLGEVEIVALDLRGDETAAELRRLAERYEADPPDFFAWESVEWVAVYDCTAEKVTRVEAKADGATTAAKRAEAWRLQDELDAKRPAEARP